MEPFVPHSFAKSMQAISGGSLIPSVLLTPTVISTIYHLVDLAADEIGMMGTVKRWGSHFLVDHVYLFEQEANGATTEINPEGQDKLFRQLMDENPGQPGLDLVNRIRIWIHSHHQMGVDPSGQDLSQFAAFKEACNDFFIMSIVNKRGSMKFWVDDYQRGIRFADVAWIPCPSADPELRPALESQFRTLVKPKTYQHVAGAGGRTWPVGKKKPIRPARYRVLTEIDRTEEAPPPPTPPREVSEVGTQVVTTRGTY